MIKIPTVFIVGAGASKPYGFPIGRELVTLICNNLINDQSRYFKQLYDLEHYNRSDILGFRNQLLYSGKGSVDAFLEHRKNCIQIGKYAIAQVLIEFEDSQKLFVKGDWYQYLYEKLNTSFEEFDQNKIGIITFNYDRSIEHYLFKALKNSYGKSDEECASKIKNIPIIHVHGQLGYLPWQDKPAREYKRESRDVINAISIAASGIRIIHEDINVNEDELFIAAHSLLRGAERIYFLGFGYNETNVKRLSIPRGKFLQGTSYNLENAEIQDVNRIFQPYGYNNILVGDKNKDSLLFIRSFILF